MTIDYVWWKEAAVYQIWPASYKDSNGDGVGDIPGIISTLDYIKGLGVDVIWFSPMYDSPQDDMGYDISDYNSIYAKYGAMQDMENLIEGVHSRGMKLILDLVINHTSSEHQWFKESSSSKESEKRDWYIWRPAQYDEMGHRHPPNNWSSYFGGSAWQYDQQSDEYYLRLFAKSQPDLNWENDECRNAIYESAVEFWMKKGIDGFRIDTAGLYSKRSYDNAPVVFPDTQYQPAVDLVLHGPRIHEFHKEMVSKVLSKYDFMTVGEIGFGTREQTLAYVSAKENEMSMIFLFDLVTLGYMNDDRFRYKGFNFQDFKQAVKSQSEFFRGSDAWGTVFIENHDQPRSVSRFGDVTNAKNLFKSAKLLAMMQSTLSGTLFVYQGQEIAMTNLPDSWDISEYLDVGTVQYYRELIAEKGNSKEVTDRVMKLLSLVARDHARSPVQWDSSEHAGFTSGKPWTRVNDNYKLINVEAQLDASDSVLSFWKKCLTTRKTLKNTLIYGSFQSLDDEHANLFIYVKQNGNERKLVVLNFSDEHVNFVNPTDGQLELLLSNEDAVIDDTMGPFEGRLYDVI